MDQLVCRAANIEKAFPRKTLFHTNMLRPAPARRRLESAWRL
jgi:hypothetical protein